MFPWRPHFRLTSRSLSAVRSHMNALCRLAERVAEPVEPTWYLAQVKPRAEALAESNLARQGFATLAPRTLRTRRRHGRFRQEFEPLFPGYLFVGGLEVEYAWRAIHHTRGVRRLVQFGNDGPARVPFNLISALRRRCDEGGTLLTEEDLTPGRSVRISSGPLVEFVATVESIPSARRVWVLLDILGQSRRVALATGDIELQ
jgi:transcriptional antiterminator RfaH